MAKSTLILLVRHGQTTTTGKVLPGRAPGLYLSELGVGQAEAAASRLKNTRIAAVYASPLERTQQTAKPIARATGNRVRTDKGLIELDVGDWTHKRLGDLRRRKEWQQVQSSPGTFTFPGGESFRDMAHRMTGTLQRLAAKHPGEAIVTVSHADNIRAAVSDAMGAHIDHFQRVVVSPCSITTLLFSDGGPMVFNLNTTSGDLSELSPT
ncbi:MAG: histidine phosphatase family protein [Acidimicrobiales bacterium]